MNTPNKYCIYFASLMIEIKYCTYFASLIDREIVQVQLKNLSRKGHNTPKQYLRAAIAIRDTSIPSRIKIRIYSLAAGAGNEPL